MPKQKLEIEIEVPDGYRCIGFGHALPGTSYIAPDGRVNAWGGENPTAGQYLILSPIERWRPATVEDVIRSLQGEEVKARFRDRKDVDWTDEVLCGVNQNDTTLYPWISSVSHWKYCEVLDTEDSNQ